MSLRRVTFCALTLASHLASASDLDLTTPRSALHAFVNAARAGDFLAAAEVLDLRAIPAERRATEGPRLSRELAFVLDRELLLDWDQVSESPEGNPADGPDADILGTIPLGAARVPVRLVRSGGVWQFGPGVVASLPALYAAYGPGWLGEHIPAALARLEVLGIPTWQWLAMAASLVAAVALALGGGAVVRRLALRVVRRTRATWDDQLVDAFSGPVRLLLGILIFTVAARSLRLATPLQQLIDQLLRISTVALFAWAGIRAIGFGSEVLTTRASAHGEDQAARSRLTQIMVMRRIAGFIVIVVGGALVLVQFDALRALGTSLLASAGVAGIVIGLAAQRSIATLLAGLQISLTQPVRVGDVVVIEGEWGVIEEITLTYVVVKVWDLRRLVVPITRILDSSFQNWTRAGSAILGTVFLYGDFSLPVDPVRKELERFVSTRPEWDGKVAGLQVTDVTDQAVQLRALVSSDDAGRNWDLRCAVREHLLSFIQQLGGGLHLPRRRIEVPGSVGAPRVAQQWQASSAGDFPKAP